MTDIRLARIEDDVQAIRGDVARLLAAVERIAGAPSFTADDDDAPAEPRPARVDHPHLVWIPDPDSAEPGEEPGEVTIEFNGNLSRWEAVFRRAVEGAWLDPAFIDPMPVLESAPGAWDAVVMRVRHETPPDEDAPVEPPRDMAASIARGLAQAAAGQVIELDPDEYRPCIEGRGGEAWPT